MSLPTQGHTPNCSPGNPSSPHRTPSPDRFHSPGSSISPCSSVGSSSSQYYYDPESRRRFRSKNEVLNYIKTGKVGRYKPKTKTSDLDASGGIKSILNPEDSGLKGRTKSKVKTGGIKMKTEDSNANNLPSASTGSHKQDGSGLKRKSAPNVDFDFDNPPEKVTWVLCNAAEGTWKAYIDDEEVPEATLKVWREVTEYLLNNPSDDEQE